MQKIRSVAADQAEIGARNEAITMHNELSKELKNIHSVAQFDERKQQLEFRISESQRKSRELNDNLEAIQKDWTLFYE